MGRKTKKDNLRTQLGLSQDHMALWLGESRSTYSMYELGQRCLPTVALLKYYEIKQAWEAFKADWQAPPAVEPDTDIDKEFKIMVLEHKLKKARYAIQNLDNLPNYLQTKDFFEQLRSTAKNRTEELVFELQMSHHAAEHLRQKEIRQKLLIEIQLLETELSILKS